MHRVDRETLYHLIRSVIHGSRLKRHKSTPITASLETQEGQTRLAELLCQQIDNDSRMVIQTEWVGGNIRLGRWGEDEPVPATVPVPPKAPTESPSSAK